MPGEDEALHALVSGNDLCTVNVAVSKVSVLSVDMLLFIKSTRQQVESNILYFKIFNRLLPTTKMFLISQIPLGSNRLSTKVD